MNLFFSGAPSGTARMLSETDPRVVDICDTHYRLFSCHGDYRRIAHKGCERLLEVDLGMRTEIMLDSGAFTAWSKGKEITLDELIPVYDEFLEKYGHLYKEMWMINLDKIPGERGRTAGAEELVEAMKISDDNFEVLKERYGGRVLPVFHQNEPKEQLFKLASKADYICISPRNDLPELSRVQWSLEAHSLIPGVKTHGLAATGARMMSQVPWGSVDSATWISLAVNGGIIQESHLKLRIIQISSKSGAIKDADAHYDTMPESERKAIKVRAAEYGFDSDDLREDYVMRMLYNRIALIKYAQRYENQLYQPGFQQSLFDL